MGDITLNGKIVDAYDKQPIPDILVYIAERPRLGSNSQFHYENLSDKDTTNLSGDFNCAFTARESDVYLAILEAPSRIKYEELTNKYRFDYDDFTRMSFNNLLAKKNLSALDNTLLIQFKRYGWMKVIVKKNQQGKNDEVEFITELKTFNLSNKDTLLYCRLKPGEKNGFVALRNNREIWRDEHSPGLRGDTITKLLLL